VNERSGLANRRPTTINRWVGEGSVWAHNNYYPQADANSISSLPQEVRAVINAAATARAVRETDISEGRSDAYRFIANFMAVIVETASGIQTHIEIGTRGKSNHSEPKMLAWMQSVGVIYVIAAFSEHVPCKSCRIVAHKMRQLFGSFKIHYAVNISIDGIASNQAMHNWWNSSTVYSGP